MQSFSALQYFLLPHPPNQSGYYRIEEESLVDIFFFELQKNKANKEENGLAPLLSSHNEQGLICITLQARELQLSNSNTLFWSLCRIDRKFSSCSQKLLISLREN
jgi:hypothetical protein